MDKKTFGQWLKQERTSKSLTQDGLAKALGLNHSQEIAAFESGSVAFPTKKIALLSKVLGVDKEKIFQMTLKIKETELRKKMEQA